MNAKHAKKSTNSLTGSLVLVLIPILLTSCGLMNSPGEEEKLSKAWKTSAPAITSSALYDPPIVTLRKGRTYEFQEGHLRGRGQKFISRHHYLKAIINSE